MKNKTIAKYKYKIKCTSCGSISGMNQRNTNLIDMQCDSCHLVGVYKYINIKKGGRKMPKHSAAEINNGVTNVYTHLVAVYGLRTALKVSKQVRNLLRAEKKRRLGMPVSERGFDEDEIQKDKVTKLKEHKDKAKAEKKKKRGPGMFASLCILFDKKGVNKVTYSDAKACAKEAKPDSNLSSGHFKWYKKQYKLKKKGH